MGHLIKRGKTTESDLQLNPTANPNPNPYLVAVRYGSLAKKITPELTPEITPNYVN